MRAVLSAFHEQLLVIELSDVMVAVDSVPAIFGVTWDPFLVYSSSMLAILSLALLQELPPRSPCVRAPD